MAEYARVLPAASVTPDLHADKVAARLRELRGLTAEEIDPHRRALVAAQLQCQRADRAAAADEEVLIRGDPRLERDVHRLGRRGRREAQQRDVAAGSVARVPDDLGDGVGLASARVEVRASGVDGHLARGEWFRLAVRAVRRGDDPVRRDDGRGAVLDNPERETLDS